MTMVNQTIRMGFLGSDTAQYGTTARRVVAYSPAMGFLSERRIERAVQRTRAALADGKAEPYQAIESLDDDEQVPALTLVAEELLAGEQLDEARVALERALALAPESWDALGLLAQLERDTPGHAKQAVAAYERLLRTDPGNPDVSADLAQVLIQDGQVDRAVTMLGTLEPDEHPAVALRLGEALVAAGRLEEALAGLSKVRELYAYRLQHGGFAGESAEARQQMAEAARLHDEIEAELAAGDSTDADEQDAGTRQVHEALTFAALGVKLMAGAPRLARELALRAPEATAAAAETVLGATPEDVDALCLLGSAWLRRNKPARARASFERARAADGHCFAPYLGLGAVLAWERHDLPRLAGGLLAPADVPGLAEILPDLAALTELERRVALASAEPLATVLPAVARAGGRVRIVPLDVRPTDLEAGTAMVWVEDLLDVETPAGWALAHALGRLAWAQLPAAVRGEVEGLARRGAAAGAEPEPPADAFARGCGDFLRWRHGRTELRKPDDEQAEALLEVCRRLAAATPAR
jgi:cytochrome c-type biogenesis protein CcmH/NrfG